MEQKMTNLRALPFEAKNIIASRARMGLIALATDHVIEHEFNLLLQKIEGTQIYTTKVQMDPIVTRETLSDMESRLTAASETLLPGNDFDVIGYGCTSASVVIGEEAVFKAIRLARPRVKITTPISACIAAIKSSNSNRIGLLTPYIEEVNILIRQYLEARDIAVVKSATFAEINDNIAGMITPESIRKVITDVFSELDLDMIFISCTSLRAVNIIPELENLLQIQVTSSNHALVWHMIRLGGIDDKIPEYGQLFTRQL
ncbi:MAG: Asp/Glu racemase [Rhodospirillaceae bacterium]|nr:Asp/Glu racemase [Rhodospirillaceae bacterium]|tara:strand:- start:24 stop:800 length:777 start_codon:yes stop_codon:yes gene_type:complete